ncbi:MULTISPECIES: hypothetical protein [Streptomyces]|uniref:Ig-like domain-containing protein n=2 Tax=Streptomyces TaxID=1883 RepID=A0ABV9IVF2_9ACTN
MNAPADRRPPQRDDYSATVLGSHWVQHGDDGTTVVDHTAAAPPPHGRVDGTVLRFGPGVTAALPRAERTAVLPAAPPARPRHRLRRHALPVLVLVAALVFLFWRGHDAPALSVRGVAVTAPARATGCDRTVEFVGVVRTDGGEGELSYRWVRSDGTTSDVLRAAVPEGRREVRLRLLWTFQGQGRYPAVAELRVLSPDGGTASARFTYDCP